MAEIYAPERGGPATGTPERVGQTKPARQANKKTIITVLAVAAIVILLLALIL